MHYTFTLDYFPPEYYAATDVFQSKKSQAASEIAGPHRKVASSSSVDRAPRTPFEWLVDDTVARIVANSAVQTKLDAALAHRTSLNGKIELNAQQWDLQVSGKKLAQLRMVHIRGSKNEIINTWIFPLCPQITPVFAAELIAVSDSVRVAFVDIQTPAACAATTDEVRLLTALLAPRFSTLPCDESAPDWATQASTGHFTYARNVPQNQISLVQDCYLSYLDTYISAFAAQDSIHAASLAQPNHHLLESLHAYQLHHMQHSPGSNYLSKLFGAEWTESFMHSFLFVMPS